MSIKIKTILKLLIILLIANNYFTMETNYSNNYLNKSLIPISLGNFLKKSFILIPLLNKTSGLIINNINNNSITHIQQSGTTCPSGLSSLLEFPTDTDEIINELTYRIYCSNDKSLMYQWGNGINDQQEFNYYSYQYLQKDPNLFNDNLKNQYDILYKNVVIFDNTTHNSNANLINDYLTKYIIKIKYMPINGVEQISYQHHLSPSLLWDSTTNNLKTTITDSDLSSQRDNIIKKYNKYNHHIESYEFFYKSSNKWTYNIDKTGSLNIINGNDNSQSIVSILKDDGSIDGNYIFYPNNILPNPCPPIVTINGSNYNPYCIFKLIRLSNLKFSHCPSYLQPYLPFKYEKNRIIDNINYLIRCIRSDKNTFFTYNVNNINNNYFYGSFSNSYISSEIFNYGWTKTLPSYLKNDFLYNSLIVFDSFDNKVKNYHNNDIVFYSLCLYYRNPDTNLLLPSGQTHFGVYVSGNNLNEEQLRNARLNIIKLYKSINHMIYIYKFHYRNGNSVEYNFYKDNNNFYYDEYMFNGNGNFITQLIPNLLTTTSISLKDNYQNTDNIFQFFNKKNKVKEIIGTNQNINNKILLSSYIGVNANSFVEHIYGSYQLSYPPFLSGDGIDYNQGGYYFLSQKADTLVFLFKESFNNLLRFFFSNSLIKLGITICYIFISINISHSI